jgi:hypothetical protein
MRIILQLFQAYPVGACASNILCGPMAVGHNTVVELEQNPRDVTNRPILDNS